MLGTQAMSCNTTSVVYLITCKRCGIQYVGEMGQELRRRMNNHRNRIKNLQPQPLYKHFNSDGHSLDDLTIQPIEEVVLEPGENMSIHSKRLAREDFWMREIKTIQPYGLNDNVKGVGNISKHYVEPVVWSFFRRCLRRRKRKPRQHPRDPKPSNVDPYDWLIQQIGNYKSMCFLKSYISNLFSCKISFIKQIRIFVNNLLPLNDFPPHLLWIAKDIARFRSGEAVHIPEGTRVGEKHFLKVTFHNKGIEMVNLSSIVHSKKVRSTLPDFIEDKEPPVISYKYTKTIGHSIFNFRKVAREHEVDGASGKGCNCIHSPFLYEPLGHVITGDLRIRNSGSLYRKDLTLGNKIILIGIYVGNFVLKV